MKDLIINSMHISNNNIYNRIYYGFSNISTVIKKKIISKVIIARILTSHIIFLKDY